ncbi:MAG: hypothetical protein OJF50_005706 [Nitrospira sp.]|nr:hypothetical protein [Nitrospira sp.]
MYKCSLLRQLQKFVRNTDMLCNSMGPRSLSDIDLSELES